MKKRVVVLERKRGDGISVYPTVVELLMKNADIDITINALWNALSKGGGKYENKDYLIYYKKQAEPIAWQ